MESEKGGERSRAVGGRERGGEIWKGAEGERKEGGVLGRRERYWKYRTGGKMQQLVKRVTEAERLGEEGGQTHQRDGR